LLQRQRLACLIELDYAVVLRIAHPIREYMRPLSAVDSGQLLKLQAETLSVEQIVAQCQRASPRTDAVGAKQQRMRKALRLVLLGILDRDAERRAIAEEASECVGFVRRGDQQKVPDPGEHQRA